MRRSAVLLLLVVVLALVPFAVQSAGAAPPGAGPGVVERDRNGGYWLFTSADGVKYSLERRTRDGFNNDLGRATTTSTVAMAYDEANDALWYHDGPVVHRYLERAVGTTNTVVATLTDITGMDDGPNGSLLVVDRGQLWELSPTGQLTAFSRTLGVTGMTDVSRDSNGTVWFLANDKLYRTGAGSPTQVGGTFDGAVALDVLGGRALVGESRGHRVVAVTSDGTVTALATTTDPVVSLARSGADLFFITRSAAGGPGILHHVDATTGATVSPTTTTSTTTTTTAPPATSSGAQGYRFVASDGGIFTYGSARFHGSTGGRRLNQPIVGGATLPGGYWLVARDGGVFTFGTAPFLGSAVGRTASPVVAMVATPKGDGYFIFEENGAIHTFGTAGSRPNAAVGRVAAAAPSPSGGYVVVGTDGRVQPGGGTEPPAPRRSGLTSPMVGIAAAPGSNWWAVTADGRVFSSGGAPIYGQMAGQHLNRPIVDIIPTPSGRGYWLLGGDGGVFSFGDARFLGSTGNLRLNQPIVGAIPG